jgi:hypothetical protein
MDSPQKAIHNPERNQPATHKSVTQAQDAAPDQLSTPTASVLYRPQKSPNRTPGLSWEYNWKISVMGGGV